MSPGTVLVVDDEDAVRALFDEILTAEGYYVQVVSDGRQAWDALQREVETDVVITDLVMPNQEGIETIQKLRQNYPRLRIIAMSGAYGGQFLHMAKLMGADEVLRKPVDPEQLCSTVAKLLSNRG